jgi:hypothetical protein
LYPNIPDIQFSSKRDAGTCVIYTFGFTEGRERRQVEAILGQITAADEISVADPADPEASYEVRRAVVGFERKHGRHGSYGTWISASNIEAVEWLLQGAEASSKTAKAGFGGVLTCKRQ